MGYISMPENYYLRIINLAERLIKNINDDNYLEVFNDNKELLEDVFSIAYFLLSKEFYIDKDKSIATPDRLQNRLVNKEWNTDIIDQLPSFYYEPNSISGMELMDRIRDSILHCTGVIDFDNRIVIINNPKEGRELSATIPFEFFTEYFKFNLYDEVNTNEYNYNYCWIHPHFYHLFHNIDDSNIEKALSSFNFFKFSFKSENKFSIIDLRKIVTIMMSDKNILSSDGQVIKTMISESLLDEKDVDSVTKTIFSNACAEFKKYPSIIEKNKGNLESFFNLEIIKYYLKKKYNIDFTYEYMEKSEKELQEELNLEDGFSYSVDNFAESVKYLTLDDGLPFMYMKLLIDSFDSVKDIKDNPNLLDFYDICLDGSLPVIDKIGLIYEKMKNENYDSIDIWPILGSDLFNNVDTLQKVKKHVVDAIMYACFTICYCANKAEIDNLSGDEIEIPDGMKAYSSKKYNQQVDQKSSFERIFAKKKSILDATVAKYKELSSMGKTREELKGIKNTIKKISDDLIETRKKIKEIKIDDPDSVVIMEGKNFVITDDKKETLTIIRNCFSHLGRVKIRRNDDDTIEFFDYSETNELSGYIKTDIYSLFEFLKQPSFTKVINAKKEKTI